MTQASFTLLGAVIGVILSGVVANAVQRASERRAQSAAARLVHAELTGIASQVKVAIDLESPLPFVLQFTDAWQEMRPVLAQGGVTCWDDTSSAYTHVELIRLSYASLDSAQAHGSINDAGVTELRKS